MDLSYKSLPDNLGGGAVSGCGTILLGEIKPTLDSLTQVLNLPFNLNEYTLGSTGKKDYSGDIDLVIDDAQWPGTIGEFREKLDNVFGIHNTARHGNMIHLKYPIVGYKDVDTKYKPRTGFVQVDFNFGNVSWEKFYHFSAGKESKYKGAHRNLAISAICASNVLYKSDDVDTYMRPLWEVRWKFSPIGFFKVRRISVKELNTGIWKRKQDDVVLDGPIFDPEFIAETLFPFQRSENSLDSLETIIENVKINYGNTDQERIWNRIADNFSEWKDGKNFLYPPEINRYFPVNDK